MQSMPHARTWNTPMSPSERPERQTVAAWPWVMFWVVMDHYIKYKEYQGRERQAWQTGFQRLVWSLSHRMHRRIHFVSRRASCSSRLLVNYFNTRNPNNNDSTKASLALAFILMCSWKWCCTFHCKTKSMHFVNIQGEGPKGSFVHPLMGLWVNGFN